MSISHSTPEGFRAELIEAETVREVHTGRDVALDGAFDDEDPWMEPDGVLLVVEVTSDDAMRDRAAQRVGYVSVGIPLYPMVDRFRHPVVLHSDPR